MRVLSQKTSFIFSLMLNDMQHFWHLATHWSISTRKTSKWEDCFKVITNQWKNSKFSLHEPNFFKLIAKRITEIKTERLWRNLTAFQRKRAFQSCFGKFQLILYNYFYSSGDIATSFSKLTNCHSLQSFILILKVDSSVTFFISCCWGRENWSSIYGKTKRQPDSPNSGK